MTMGRAYIFGVPPGRLPRQAHACANFTYILFHTRVSDKGSPGKVCFFRGTCSRFFRLGCARPRDRSGRIPRPQDLDSACVHRVHTQTHTHTHTNANEVSVFSSTNSTLQLSHKSAHKALGGYISDAIPTLHRRISHAHAVKLNFMRKSQGILKGASSGIGSALACPQFAFSRSASLAHTLCVRFGQRRRSRHLTSCCVLEARTSPDRASGARGRLPRAATLSTCSARGRLPRAAAPAPWTRTVRIPLLCVFLSRVVCLFASASRTPLARSVSQLV